MKPVKWNDGWKFWPDRNAFALVWDIPEAARDIPLPHDAMIETPAHEESLNRGNTGYRDGGNYTYVKTFFVPEGDTGKYLVRFEGGYAHALVYVNQQLAGTEANGYASFYVDLTSWLRPGEENELRVQVKNAGMTNSRWYSGSGIYRDVYLLRSGPVYIEPDSVQVTTESADETYAVLSVKTAVINETPAPKELCLSTAVSPRENGGPCAGTEHTVFFVKPGETRTVTQRILVKFPALWSENSPALYLCESSLLEAGGGAPLDTACDTFGIRTLALDAARGLRVNGVSVKLRGACIHHDSGMLGAATYEDAHYRQIKLLKEHDLSLRTYKLSSGAESGITFPFPYAIQVIGKSCTIYAFPSNCLSVFQPSNTVTVLRRHRNNENTASPVIDLNTDMGLWSFHDGIAVLNADCIIEPPHRFGASPKISEFSGVVQRGGVPDDVIMDVGFVNVGADDKCVSPLGEAHRQLVAQAVGFLRGDLAGDKGLAYLIGQHIVRPPLPAGLGEVLPLCEKKLSIGNPAVTLVACDEPAAVCLFRVFHIANDVADRCPH